MRQVTWIILGIVLLAGEAPAALYESANGPFVTLIEAGRSQAQIVVSDKPAFLEEFAASELRTYLRKISGVNVPIVKETERDGRLYGFFLGKTERSEASGVVPDERTMGLDGFALRSVPEGLVVLGRTDLGTLFGVYELLERYFDVRWFMPGDLGECVPRREAVRMGQVDLTHRPSFRVRWIGNGEWPLRQRMNVDVTVGNQSVGIKWRWNFHSFNKLMSPEQYFSGHPEYFALVNGKRDVTDSKTHGNQLCTSNSAVIAEIAKNLTAVLDAEPDIEVIALSPNDGGGFCECEACESLDEPDHDWFGRYSRRLMTFNNEVAKRVKEKHPDVFIKVGAYAMYARKGYPLASTDHNM